MSDGEPPTVLVVDDEPDVADAYSVQLAREYDVETVYSGAEAIDSLSSTVDVVLLDRRMPGVSGDDVLAHIREEGYDCRVAMVTAVDPDFDIIELPFDDYVIKPASRDDLMETIERLLTCAEYEEQFQEYYALTSKYAALLANKSNAELANSEQFQALRRRRRATREQLTETVEQFDDTDFEALFRDLVDSPPAPTPLADE